MAGVKIFPWSYYTKMCNDTVIMACFIEDEGWEIYYKRQDFPFMFAFGLPMVHKVDEVFDIAEGNIENYEDMFK